MKLSQDFYRMRAPELAPALLGKLLCRKICKVDSNGTKKFETVKLRITETECYFGEDDTACHAHKGYTNRTKTMYQDGGVAYVYLCYGIHSLLNVVSGSEGFPEAVLIRSVEGYNGPGKLTKAMNIDKRLNGVSFVTSDEIWIENDGTSTLYKTGKRIGICYASEKDKNILWRFTLI